MAPIGTAIRVYMAAEGYVCGARLALDRARLARDDAVPVRDAGVDASGCRALEAGRRPYEVTMERDRVERDESAADESGLDSSLELVLTACFTVETNESLGSEAASLSSELRPMASAMVISTASCEFKESPSLALLPPSEVRMAMSGV